MVVALFCIILYCPCCFSCFSCFFWFVLVVFVVCCFSIVAVVVVVVFFVVFFSFLVVGCWHRSLLNPPRGFRGNRGHGTTRFQECDSKKMEIVCFRLYSFLLPILFTYRPAKINFQIKEYRNVRYGSNNQKLRCS